MARLTRKEYLRKKEAEQKLSPEKILAYKKLGESLGLIPNSKPDFASFCEFVRIPRKEVEPGQDPFVTFSKANWFPEQIDFEKNRTGLDVVLKSRQIGFTTFESIRDLFFALSRPASKVRIIAQAQDVSKATLRLLRDTYLELHEGFPMFFPSLDSEGMIATQTTLRFQNKSEIEVLSAGKNESQVARGRGGKVDRLHCTEIAHWAFPEDTMVAQLGAQNKNTEIVWESTPIRMGDYFYNLCQTAQLRTSPYKFHFWPWMINPTCQREGPAILGRGEDGVNPRPKTNDEKELMRIWPSLTYEQMCFWRDRKVALKSLAKARAEYPMDAESCFQTRGSMFITGDERQWLSSICQTGELGMHGSRVYEKPGKWGMTYIVGADIAAGRGGDNSAIVVLNINTLEVACTWSDNQTSPTRMATIIRDVASLYNDATIVVENMHDGKVTCTALQQMQGVNLYRGQWNNYSDPGAWLTNLRTRPFIFSAIKDAIREKAFEGPFCPILKNELVMLTGGDKPVALNKKNKNGLSGATEEESETGNNDDLTIAYGIALVVRGELVVRNSGMPIIEIWSREQERNSYRHPNDTRHLRDGGGGDSVLGGFGVGRFGIKPGQTW